jgi:hypothetical protein
MWYSNLSYLVFKKALTLVYKILQKKLIAQRLNWIIKNEKNLGSSLVLAVMPTKCQSASINM